MSGWRFARWFEVANREKERDGCRCDPREDAEAVHERQQAHLMLKLLEDTALHS